MPAKILVADADSSVESEIEQQFSQQIADRELEFLFVTNGGEALEKLQADRQIDLVIASLNLPELEGLVLLERLQQNDWNLPAIVLSTDGDLKTIRSAMNRGAFDVITLPIDFSQLAASLKKGLEYRENLQQRQRSRYKLSSREKMVVLGQVSAGLAHDLNNPLNFIVGNLEPVEDYIKDLLEHLELYQQKFTEPGEEIEEHAEEIDLEYLIEDLNEVVSSMKRGTDRLQEISNSLRVFARVDTSSKVSVNVRECIDSTLLLLKQRFKGKDNNPIKLVKEYGELPQVDCFPGQINQVLMTLIVNRIDALEFENKERSPAEIKANPNSLTIRTEIADNKERIAIRIKDNSSGIVDLTAIAKSGVKSGLELAMIREIVEEKHGGQFTCSSGQEEGTEFTIEIPVQ